MSYDAIFALSLFVGTIVIVLASVEVGHRLGGFVRAGQEKDTDAAVAPITPMVLALLAFILAFTFSMASDRFAARKELVTDEANKIRTAWLRSDFLPEGDRAEAKQLLRQYVRDRIAVVESKDDDRLESGLSAAKGIQLRLWDMAVVNARKDMNSDVAALYIEALNDVISVHATRLVLAVRIRIPTMVWLMLAGLTILGTSILGYQLGLAGLKKTKVLPAMALAYGLVIGMIGILDRPIKGLTIVPQQPLIDLLTWTESAAVKGK